MRDNLKLTAATFELNKRSYTACPAMQEIITKYDTGATHHLVDVGAYVLSRAREVIELD